MIVELKSLSAAGEQPGVLTPRDRFPDALGGEVFTRHQERHQPFAYSCRARPRLIAAINYRFPR